MRHGDGQQHREQGFGLVQQALGQTFRGNEFGARYSASKYASQAGNVEVGGYTVFDVGTRYRTRVGGYETVLRLTVDNLFDKRYWRDVGDYLGDNYLFQGAPRTARLSASVSF